MSDGSWFFFSRKGGISGPIHSVRRRDRVGRGVARGDPSDATTHDAAR